MIKISLSYTDLTCLVEYSLTLNTEINQMNNVNGILKVAYISEITRLHDQLNKKLICWPLAYRKSIRSVNITPMQGYILWTFYHHSSAKFILLNDKIEHIIKYLLLCI